MEPITSKEMHDYRQSVETLLNLAKREGASQAEVSASLGLGFSVEVRKGSVETVEFNRDKGMGVTVYFGQRKGSASTSDTRPEALVEAVKAACHIARFTHEDPYTGLADAALMAFDYPDLELNHPWSIVPAEAIDLAIQCETAGCEIDPRITNSEGVSIATHQQLTVYGNSHGFIGECVSTRHSASCSLIAQDSAGMQRDYAYTVARHAKHLRPVEEIGQEAARKAIARLSARSLKTQQVPVIFAREIASGIFGQFISAIRGGNLYRKASFLVDHLEKKIFPDSISIDEKPYILGALGSAPFDGEGVKLCDRVFIEKGILKTYVLGSYSARKLGMQTTGHAGGVYNIQIHTPRQSFKDLVKHMHRGFIVTELIGQGINLVTGDYSRGASGFWVENGEIQYPVHEVTIAGNLREMFQRIIAMGDDINPNATIDTGSILIEQMTVAGV